jgi:hypothetical protein
MKGSNKMNKEIEKLINKYQAEIKKMRDNKETDPYSLGYASSLEQTIKDLKEITC